VALGVLVDDAIIGIENILRRLRENARFRRRGHGLRSSATHRSKCGDR